MMDTTVVMVNALEEPLSASSTRAAVVGFQGLQGFRASVENAFDSGLHLIGGQEGAGDGSNGQRGWCESKEGEERQAPRHDASTHGCIANEDDTTELDEHLQS